MGPLGSRRSWVVQWFWVGCEEWTLEGVFGPPEGILPKKIEQPGTLETIYELLLSRVYLSRPK